jgi:hypothetical protein
VSEDFRRSLRALRADQGRGARAAALVALALVLAWGAWLRWADLPVRVSGASRVEAAGAGEWRASAWLPARVALGRVRPGQRARLSLDAFPPVQYGMYAAVVARVSLDEASERVRVELRVDPPAPGRQPLEPGLRGTVEIEVGRVSPLKLLLRAAGGGAS